MSDMEYTYYGFRNCIGGFFEMATADARKILPAHLPASITRPGAPTNGVPKEKPSERDIIAEALHRSPKTIDNHRTSIGRKLNLADRVDLAQIASDAGLEIRDAQRKRVDPNNFGDD